MIQLSLEEISSFRYDGNIRVDRFSPFGRTVVHYLDYFYTIYGPGGGELTWPAISAFFFIFHLFLTY